MVGGGGFSGVEAIAELNDFIREVKGNYQRLRNEEVRCVLVQSGDRILPEMAEPLAVFAQTLLPQTRRRDHPEGPSARGHLASARS